MHFIYIPLENIMVYLSTVFSEIFPYLVVMVGMEKVMIIVKAVVSTPASNPVKIRIAEGTKNNN